MSETVTAPVHEPAAATLQTVASLKQRIGERSTGHQRAIDTITGALSRPLTVYVLCGTFALWIAVNLVLPALGYSAFDHPPFVGLQGVIALYLAVTTTTVLTTQARQNRESEERALLEFQVNLMAEQRTAKIIALLEELRRDSPAVRNRVDHVADAMQVAVDPASMFSAIEATLDEAPAGPSVSAADKEP